MWDERGKSTSLRGPSINFFPTASELSFAENKRFVHPHDSSDGQFLAEASRKRKAMDSDMVNNVYDGVSPRFWANHSGNFEHVLSRESSSQRNVVTIDSQRRTPEMFSDHNSQSAKPSGALSQFGNYQFYNMNNSLMSLQGRDENFQETAVDSSKSCTFLYNGPSFLIKTPVGGTPKLPDLQSHAYDMPKYSEASKLQLYYKQSGDSMEKTQATLRSNNGMNSRFGNNDLPSTQCPLQTMPSQNLTFVESSKLRMLNEEFNPGGGTYIQDSDKSGLVEVKKSGQFGVAENNHIPISATNCGQKSVQDGKEVYGSYLYTNTEIRSTHYPFNGVLGTHPNVRGTDMLQIPVLTESSDLEDARVDNGMLKNMGHFSKDLGTETMGKEDGSNNEYKCHSLEEGTSPETANTLARKPVELHDSPPCLNLDEQSKPVAAKISPVIVEKLWDGSLQLNTSTVVSTVAFFKSGEKAQDIKWSEHIDIKGKVRLQAFEKFIQELPRSRNRALMVISLCWKVGSSKAGLTGMKEVSKGYRASGRVGFAQICPGIDLYVCPRSDTIITILAKYGFFKGMAAVEEDHDSFIGCIVWRRGLSASNPAPQKPERKRVPLPEQPVISPESSVVETNSPLTIINDSDSRQATPCTREPDRPADLDIARDKPSESNDLHDAPSHQTVSVPVTAPVSVQLPAVQKPELSSPRETVEHAEIPIMQVMEPRNLDLGSESTPSVFPGPPPKLPAILQRNTQSSNDLHSQKEIHTGSVPESNPLNSLVKQVLPSTPHWPYPSMRVDPTGSVSNAGIPAVHNTELRKPDMGVGLPGPPQLPPEVLQRMIQSNRDAHQGPAMGMIKAEIPIIHITEPIGPTIPRAPQSLPHGPPDSVDHDDQDDLPEFDFNSARGVPVAPVSKFPWSGLRSPFVEAQQFNKQLPIERAKNVGWPMPVVPMSTEVMQRAQASSFPEKSFGTHQGISLPTKFGGLDYEKEHEYLAPWSFSRSSTVEADKEPSISKSQRTFPHMIDWDEDDDMPEWCPPGLAPRTTAGLPSPILRPTSDIPGPPRPPLPAQSQTSFRQPQSEGLLRGCQLGLLGPRPGAGDPPASVRTRPVARFVQPEMRPPMAPVPNQNHSSGQPIFDIKPPSDVTRGWRRG